MLLTVENLHTHFRLEDGGTARAVDGISFSVGEGETVALVGESGCGKSVTAFSIMRLLPDNAVHPAGAIRFAGEDLLRKSQREMESLRGDRLAMIFQEPMTSLNPVMRIGKQLAEPLRLHQGMSAREAGEEAVRLLRRVGIAGAESRVRDYPHQLSGGMRQRVMIAMALACRSRLLIADEPTTALDVTIQAQILGLMQDLQAETGMAILFITHDLGIVNQIADRVCVMYAGQIVEQGSREEIFRNMGHPYTRALFRALPQNGSRGRPLYAIPGNVPSATALPSGCHFHDRCVYRFERCPREEGRAHEIGGPGHTAACHWRENGGRLPELPLLSEPEVAEAAVSPQRTVAAATSSSVPPTPETAAGGGAPALPEEPLLTICDLRTHFPVKHGIFGKARLFARAVDGLSLSITRGQTLALVGESGCGKTTVGLSLLRLLKEARGQIVFQGRDLAGWDRQELRRMRRHLQIVFQDPFSSLSPRLTVEDIVSEGVGVHFPELGPEVRRDRVGRALQEVGLDESAYGRYPHEFSGGQRQRISLARALVLEPDFLVLDEPTSSLDVSVQAQILNLLIRLQARHGFTYLIISHNLALVEYLADAVAVMYLGRIVEHAPAAELFAGPLHPYTRSLLAAVPSVTDRRPLVRLEGEMPSPVSPPSGCHFHPRCPVYGAAVADSPLWRLCPARYPELLGGAPGHSTACHAVHPPTENDANIGRGHTRGVGEKVY